MFPSDLSVEGWLSHLCDLVPGTHTVYLRRAGSKCYDLYQPGAPPMSFETPTAHLMPWVMVKSYTSDTRAIERWARAGRRKSFDDVLSSIHLGRVECMLDVFTGFHENQAAIVASEEALVVWGDDHQSALALLLQVHRQLGGLDVDVLSPVVVPASLNNSPLARHAALSPRAVVNSPMLGDMPAGFEHDFLGLRPSPEPDFGSSPSSRSTSVITPSPLSSGIDLESVLYTPYDEPFTIFPSPRPHEYGPLLDHTTVLSEDYIDMPYDPVKPTYMGYTPESPSSFPTFPTWRWADGPDLRDAASHLKNDISVAGPSGTSSKALVTGSSEPVASPAPAPPKPACTNIEDIVPDGCKPLDDVVHDVEMEDTGITSGDPVSSPVRQSPRRTKGKAKASKPARPPQRSSARVNTRSSAKQPVLPSPDAPSPPPAPPALVFPPRATRSRAAAHPSSRAPPQPSSSRATRAAQATRATSVEDELADSDAEDDADYEDHGDDDDSDDDWVQSRAAAKKRGSGGKPAKKGARKATSAKSRAAKKRAARAQAKRAAAPLMCRLGPGCKYPDHVFSRTGDRERHEKVCKAALFLEPVPCTICGRPFSRRDAMLRHQQKQNCSPEPDANEDDRMEEDYSEEE